MSSHACPVAGCGAPIAHYLLICSADWRRVPMPLRQRYDRARQKLAREGNAASADLRATFAELQAAVIETASARRLAA